MPYVSQRYVYAAENGDTVFSWDGRHSLAAAFSHAKRRMAWGGRFAEVVRFVKDTRTGKLFPLRKEQNNE